MRTIKVPTEVVDMRTGEVVERRMSDMHIAPPADPLACPMCAKRHPPEQPHNAQSLHYQYSFYAEHNRWPTWKDAVAHCAEPIRHAWEAELRKGGHWPEDEAPTLQRDGA